MIKVLVPFAIDLEEFIERCKVYEVSFRKSDERGGLGESTIYVKDKQDEQEVKQIIENMERELDEEIKLELEAYSEEGT